MRFKTNNPPFLFGNRGARGGCLLWPISKPFFFLSPSTWILKKTIYSVYPKYVPLKFVFIFPALYFLFLHWLHRLKSEFCISFHPKYQYSLKCLQLAQWHAPCCPSRRRWVHGFGELIRPPPACLSTGLMNQLPALEQDFIGSMPTGCAE